MHINKIIIQDAMIFLNIKQFIKEFAELQIISLVNMQLEYNQIEFKKKICDLTEFMTILSLLWNCTFIQSETNSVAQFCWAMIQILKDLISDICYMFFDNITVKELQSDYKDKKSLSDVHQYILETIQNLNRVLVNVECVSECVFKEKLQYIMKHLWIVNYICRSKKQSFKTVKTLKFVN